MEKRILDGKASEKEKLPDDVITITHVDEEFAAGIDDDKLMIEYAIQEEYVSTLQAAKLEVYKDLAKEPCFTTSLDIKEANTYFWDGKLSEEDDDYITYKDSPFTVKITVSEDKEFEKVGVVEKKASVHPYADEFRVHSSVARHISGKTDAEKFNNYISLKEPMFKNITDNNNNRILTTLYVHPLNYLSDNVRPREFLGREVLVHDNYYPYLQRIQNELNKKYNNHYVNHPNYTFGGFNIRLQSGSTTKVSNHAFGMALDVDAAYNPQLYKKPLFLISLLTNTNIMVKSTPEEMKYASDQIRKIEVTSQKIVSMKNGFEIIDGYYEAQGALSIETLDKSFEQLDELLQNVYDLRNRTLYLSNERNFIDNRAHYSTKQAEEVEKEFYQTIPQRCVELKQEISENWNAERLKLLAQVIHNGYNPAMRLSLLYPTLYKELEQDLAVLSEFAELSQTLDDIIILTSSHQIHSVTNNSIKEVQLLVATEATLQTLSSFISSTVEKYYNAFGSQSDFKKLIEWLESGKVYSFKSNSNLPTSSFFEELSQIGFMRMSVEFVDEFLENNTFGNKDVIDWGGYWNSKKDWMHLEYVEDDRFMPK